LVMVMSLGRVRSVSRLIPDRRATLRGVAPDPQVPEVAGLRLRHSHGIQPTVA
jgi:hypothetical protein